MWGAQGFWGISEVWVCFIGVRGGGGVVTGARGKTLRHYREDLSLGYAECQFRSALFRCNADRSLRC
jgi:hypothetical protein